MMDERNTLFSQQTFARAVKFIWREAEMLDRRDYRAWLDLWDTSGFYVVPIDPSTTDYAASLNYAYDDQDMREKRVQRMTSGYSASASDAARTVRTVSRFTLTSDASDEVTVNSAQVIVHQDNICDFARNLCSAFAHRDSDISRMQSRGVVDTVTDHRNNF